MVAVDSAVTSSASLATASRATARTVWRLRMAAGCATLTALAFLQAPGKLVADTKVDLVLNPVGFMTRALQLWNPAANFGELQNQAYGYLWPMGPFFATGSLLGLPGWVTQRLWWALLLCVAFSGLVQLASRLNIGTPAARLVAGFAFALAPRIMTQLGTASVESWPMAVAPWVLVPLVGIAKGGRLRRPIALSALGVACAGGVNATAVFAVVPLALLWLAMVRPLRRRLTAIGLWCLAVTCATAWWLIPLLLLGRYSPPFLDYIETAEVTTRLTDVVTNLRGASYWVAYLGGLFGPDLPAGWTLANSIVAVIASIGLAALGIVGLSRSGMPHRRYLVTALLVGLALVGMGHVSQLDGAVSGQLRAFLDGVGAPLRNVHKFDVVLRIPLVLGFAHVLGVLARTASIERYRYRPGRLPNHVGWVLSLTVLAGVVVPAFATGLAPNGAYPQVPKYWYDAAAWFKGRLGPDRVLVVPGARFGNYAWGSTGDEVVQALLPGPWALRSAVPLTTPMAIRTLDSVDAVLASGAGSAGLADLLARSGIRYVLARSDLDYGKANATAPVVARQALQRSPGLTPVARFGPTVAAPVAAPVASPAAASFVDDGLGGPVPALEVYQVDRPVSAVAAFSADDAKRVVGGPESLLDLASAGQLPLAPTVLDGDPSAAGIGGSAAITDGLRRRDINFGGLRDNASATMTADDAFDLPLPAHDYLPAWADGRLTTVRYEGLTSLTASSAWAQPQSVQGSRPEHQPYAALDGDPSTSWRTPPYTTPAGQWIELQLASPQTISQVHLQFDLTADSVATRVTVSAGSEQATATGLEPDMTITLPGQRATRTVRITVEDSLAIANLTSGSLGISEITIPDLKVGRTVVVPPSATVGPATGSAASASGQTAPRQTASGQAATVVVTAGSATPACFFADGNTQCSTAAQRSSEDSSVLDRTVTLPSSASYAATLWATPRAGAELDALLDRELAKASGSPSAVSASSRGIADPAARPGAVLDGDPTTAWSPEVNDTHPMLKLSWTKPREITGIQLTLAAGVAATQVHTVRVVGDDGVRAGYLDGAGRLMFNPPLHSDDLSVFLLDEPTATSYDPRTRSTRKLPLAVGELSVLPAAAKLAIPADVRVDLPCGSGPTLRVGSTEFATKLIATRQDLVQRRQVATEFCGDARRLSLPSGTLHLVARPSGLATAQQLALVPAVARSAPSASRVGITEWSATHRRLTVDAAATDRIVYVRENANDGWQATVAGKVLRPVVVDGWQQGWLMPAGAHGDIVVDFTPNQPYQLALLGGAGLLLVIGVLALWPSRRRGAHTVVPPGSPGDGRILPLVVGAVALVVIGGAAGAVVAFVGAVATAYRRILTYPPGPAGRKVRRTSRLVQSAVPVALVVVAGVLAVRENSHVAAAPQLAGLLAVALLWVSVVRRPAPTLAIERRGVGDGTGEQRPLDHIPADGRQQQTAHQHDGEYVQEVPGEQWPVTEVVDRFENGQVPQEKSIRD